MPESAAFAPRFCPNGDILFELQADHPGFAKRNALASLLGSTAKAAFTTGRAG
jgi:hypothetical protein